MTCLVVTVQDAAAKLSTVGAVEGVVPQAIAVPNTTFLVCRHRLQRESYTCTSGVPRTVWDGGSLLFGRRDQYRTWTSRSTKWGVGLKTQWVIEDRLFLRQPVL
mmetsp:Transcript_41843/g.65387  ORF Transcript_41843/g.65387 Transcript_41843/m.65387 type:complete len:104 (+) Transcript_41843:311-622(+)